MKTKGRRQEQRDRAVTAMVLAFLGKPSTIALIILVLSILALVITSYNQNINPAFYTTMDTIIKVVLGSFGGTLVQEHYQKGKAK